jgi:hypothetical protein
MFHCISVLFDFNPAHPDQLLIFEENCKRIKKEMKQIDFKGLEEILNQRMIVGSEVPPLSYQLREFLS